jgi:hypothetical protein
MRKLLYEQLNKQDYVLSNSCYTMKVITIHLVWNVAVCLWASVSDVSKHRRVLNFMFVRYVIIGPSFSKK